MFCILFYFSFRIIKFREYGRKCNHNSPHDNTACHGKSNEFPVGILCFLCLGVVVGIIDLITEITNGRVTFLAE